MRVINGSPDRHAGIFSRKKTNLMFICTEYQISNAIFLVQRLTKQIVGTIKVVGGNKKTAYILLTFFE